MSEEPLDDVRLALATVEVFGHSVDHLGERPGALATDRVGLHIVVEQLDRIELRAVTR